MGRFFTSTQIYNPKLLDRDGFKADFCDKMAKEGYEVCEPECAELSYVLAFADNCKWVTISSEAYEQGNRTSQADTARIAKMLGTYCVNTIVIDSDCAMLDLYDDNGKKADTLVMGRADDYLGDDIPAPVKALWEKFLSADSTWEQFISVVQGNYVFVEDGLSELAPVIGMDGGNILFEYEDADESNENFCYLSFRKASSKKEKKLTINAAFKQVFGEALEPMGFKLVKSKHPYFVRVVNGEILHVITYKTEQAQYPEDKAFNILCGVATIYRQQIDLNAGIKSNYNWLRNSIADFYAIPLGNEYDNYFRQTISRFNYFSTIESSLINVMKEASILTEKYVLPVINEINTLENCITFFQKYKLPFSTNDYRKNINFNDCNPEDEGFLYIQADYIAKKNKLEEILSSPDINEIKRNRTKEIYSFFIESEIRNIALGELQRRKNANLEILKSYGIDFEKPQPKKEKKLTINAAFKQVFGEALEPLGFVKIKSRYPYFVRVVNGEILHVITCLTESSGFRGKKAFQIYGGIATVYRDNIDLSISPNENKEWLETNSLLYYRVANRCTKSMVNKMDYYLYEEDDIKSMLSELKKALNITKQIMILYFDTIQNIDTCINHFFKLSGRVYTFSDYFEGLIFLKTANYVQLIEENIKQHRAIYKRNVDLKKKGFTQEEYEKRCQRHELVLKRELAPIENILTIPELYTKYNKELERRKKYNLEILKSYGIPLE